MASVLPVMGVAGVVALGACLAAPPASQPATQSAEDAEQLDFTRRPISYFNNFCASCHGDYGSFWGEGFAAGLEGERLREVVRQMAAGPAFAPLEAPALDVQTAYHRSLMDGKPFLSVFKDASGLVGEVTPGSTVTLTVDGTNHPAEVDGHTWRSRHARASAIRAELGEATTQVTLDEEPRDDVRYSHAGETPATRPATSAGG